MEKSEPINIASDDATQLVARFRSPLMSFFLRRAHNREDAEDLTQEVFMRILRRDETVPVQNPEIYIFRIAANLLRDRARKATTHRAADHASLDAVDADLADNGKHDPSLIEDRGPERVLLSQEALIEAVRTLGELGDRTRDIFLLFRLENMRHREIAALYGITVSTVEKHIAKAGVHLSRKFGPL